MKFLDRELPPLGMGCWVIGGPFFKGSMPLGFGEVDDKESIRTIHAALDAGIRVFDTATAYGAGHGERVVGQALTGRSDVIVISKIGMAIDEDARQILDDDTDPAGVEAAIDRSLTRLQRDHLDAVLLHLNTLPIDTAAPMFEAMEKVRQRGKIGAYGWSTDIPESVKAMTPMPGFACVEHAMNVFRDAPSMQSTMEDLGLAALIRSPLAMGVLTGKFSADAILPEDDHRAVENDWHDYFSGGKVSKKYLRNLDAIRELLRTGGRSLSQGALCWLLAKSDRNLPIPGARTVAQMTENAGALQHGPLPEAIMAEIESLIEREPEGELRPR